MLLIYDQKEASLSLIAAITRLLLKLGNRSCLFFHKKFICNGQHLFFLFLHTTDFLVLAKTSKCHTLKKIQISTFLLLLNVCLYCLHIILVTFSYVLNVGAVLPPCIQHETVCKHTRRTNRLFYSFFLPVSIVR